MAETYYERLDVATDASVESIERAYRDRLKETHPDVSDDPRAAARTRALIEARRVLTDEHERAVYDRIGHAAYTAADSDASEPESTSETGSTTSTTGQTAAGAGTSTDHGSWAAADASTAGGATATTGTTDRERRRRQNRETRAAWNPKGGVADGGVYAHEWRAWDTNSAYRIHPTDPSGLGSRLFPIGPSLVMLLVAFGLYPVLLWGSLEPAFPLVFNVLMGICLLALVGFLASMPPIGVTVFGTWLVFLPGVLALAGVPLGSPPWIAVLLGTGTPLVLSTVIWAALRT